MIPFFDQIVFCIKIKKIILIWEIDMKKNDIIKVVAWIVSFELISSAIGFFSRESVDGWYQTLTRSALTPPDFVFGPVWTILYAMLAAAGFLLWKRDKGQLGDVKSIYMLQMLLNWSWMPLFFTLNILVFL